MTGSASGAERFFMRAWSRRGLVACALWPISLLYRTLASLRRLLYRSGALRVTRMPVPVIVVGNVFIGGTGKTPLTIWLVEALQNAGLRPGVISRGYGTHNSAPREVTSASHPADVGDEPCLIAHRTKCPVMVGRQRVAAARALLEIHPEVDVIVSDDGLQHYALHRDLEIVLSDERGNGNGWVLPAGPLREPASRRRDFTVINATTHPQSMTCREFAMRLEGEFAQRLGDPSDRVALAGLHERSLAAAAGIGNPSRFFAMLRKAGLDPVELPLPDHYDFADNPFTDLQADIILITEKDAVKCARLDSIKSDPRLWVVPVTARIDAALAEQIVEKCCGRPTA